MNILPLICCQSCRSFRCSNCCERQSWSAVWRSADSEVCGFVLKETGLCFWKTREQNCSHLGCLVVAAEVSVVEKKKTTNKQKTKKLLCKKTFLCNRVDPLSLHIHKNSTCKTKCLIKLRLFFFKCFQMKHRCFLKYHKTHKVNCVFKKGKTNKTMHRTFGKNCFFFLFFFFFNKTTL